MKTKPGSHPAEPVLRAHAASFPETKEDFPWGESAFKVKGKVFLFMRAHSEGLGLSVKLPVTNERALANSFAEPTGYGLGKSGWVSARFGPDERVPIDLMKAWIEESFRAVAPKKVLAQLDGGSAAKASAPKTTAKKPAAKKKAAKRATRKAR
jgi:predicted DNA-binding protein (MmcQ/YjbR family)